MLSPVKESDSNCGNMPSISCSCSSWRCAHWLIPCGQEALSAAHPALQPQLGQPSSGDAGVSSDGIPLWLASGPLSSRLFSTQHNCFPVRLERWSLFFPCALTDHLSIKKTEALRALAAHLQQVCRWSLISLPRPPGHRQSLQNTAEQ